MPVQGLRRRKNGLFELRFQLNNKTVSVYGKTPEECIQKRAVRILNSQRGGDVQSVSYKTVFSECMRYCEEVFRQGNVHEEGFSSLKKTARFIGRSPIGNVDVDALNDEMICCFKTSVEGYAQTTINKAVYLLKRIMK